jgi:hypothetical protein
MLSETYSITTLQLKSNEKTENTEAKMFNFKWTFLSLFRYNLKFFIKKMIFASPDASRSVFKKMGLQILLSNLNHHLFFKF